MLFLNFHKASNTILNIHCHIMSDLVSFALGKKKSKGKIVFCLVFTIYCSVNNNIPQSFSQQILASLKVPQNT